VKLEFKENLPEQCPPADASEAALESVCRFLFFSPPDAIENYASHIELGKPTGSAPECKARSCSLFKMSNAAKQAKKIGIFKNRKIAVLNIPEGCGAHSNGKNGHIDFWQARNFSPSTAIVNVYDSTDDIEDDTSDA